MESCFLCRSKINAEGFAGQSILCMHCWAQIPLCTDNSGHYALGYYLDILEELLKLYKLERHLVLGQLFAAMLQEAYWQKFSGFYVVPVAPRPARLKYEAWDPVAYLCHILWRKYRIPVLNLLQRKDNQQHKNLGKTARKSFGDYSLLLSAQRQILKASKSKRSKSKPSKKSGLRLLLLDDVYTTGATIGMCRAALSPLANHIEEVASLTICLVP